MSYETNSIGSIFRRALWSGSVDIWRLLWWLLNKARIVDFMIATESEMRKVNWPTRREIVGSTWIVISGTFLMAFLLFTVNLTFAKLFMVIGVLEGGG